MLLACLVPGLVLATGAPASGDDGDKVTFTVGLRNEVDSFNPFLGIEAPAYEMWALTYDYMIGYDNETMAPTPTGLATSWDTSDDGRTWTFHIRDGVTWSDGEPLTAADIAYTYNRVLDGEVEGTTWRAYLTGVRKVTAPDAETVVLQLRRPNAVLPLLPIPVIPEHVWKDVAEDEVKDYTAEPTKGEPVVGSGPFRLVEGSALGSTYRFEANPDYWGGAPHIDEIVFRVYKADDPAVQALVKGEIDFVWNIQPIQVQALEDQPGITAHNGAAPGFEEIAFNTGAIDTETEKPIGDGNPALEDPAFRHALGYAIDLDEIIDKAYQGAGTPGSTIVPDTYSLYHWEPPQEEAFVYDPGRAGELLDEAGYTLDGDGRRRMPDGSPIAPLRLFARTESPSSLKTMNFFKEWLADVGIESQVRSLESNNLTNVILAGDFDAFAWGWLVEPDPHTMLSYMTCDQRGDWSDSWYCNPEYDRLFEQQAAETDEDARIEQVKRMQQILYEDSPYLVTAYDSYSEAFRSDRFACLVPQPEPDGVWIMQYGVSSYLSVRPVDEAGDCGGVKTATAATDSDESDGMPTAVLVGLGAAVVLVAGGAGALALRRRGSADDRE